MKMRLIGYWLATGLFCLAMTGGGIMNLIRHEFQREAMTKLGYPEYLMTILGTAKVVGVVVVLIPGVLLLKEWAYAGFTCLLLGATASHVFAGDPISETIAPLIVLAIALASYFLRPPTRRIQLATHSSS